MSDEHFEIAFSGQIAEGANLETVKQHIAKIFKADEKRLAQMFSGRRVLIKREADAATVAKYRGAFEKAGAICEIRPLTTVTEETGVSTQSPSTGNIDTASASAASTEDYVSRYPESDQIPQALLTDPLGVTGDNIQDLQADIAPVGSQMQHQIVDVPEPSFDLNGIEVAPVGSDLSETKQDEPPPPPDISGLSMAD